MVDFTKMSQVWFYGAWQEVAMRHRTPYIKTKHWTFYKINSKAQNVNTAELGLPLKICRSVASK